jgi:hypothetical protein
VGQEEGLMKTVEKVQMILAMRAFTLQHQLKQLVSRFKALR